MPYDVLGWYPSIGMGVGPCFNATSVRDGPCFNATSVRDHPEEKVRKAKAKAKAKLKPEKRAARKRK